MTAFYFRELDENDAEAFRDIRLEALRLAPESFGSSFEEESERGVAEFAARLSSSHVVGAFDDKGLVGVGGFYVLDRVKTAHRGYIWGVYVRPAARRRGLARAIVEQLLTQAVAQVEQVHLAVVATNLGALQLYQDLGFRIYGTEPHALRVDGRDFDEHLMVKRFDSAR